MKITEKELEIAKRNIKRIKEHKKVKVRVSKRFIRGNWEHLESLISNVVSHKQSCQRFLEFLKGFNQNTTAKDSAWMQLQIKPKITDLKNVIKVYKENGNKK